MVKGDLVAVYGSLRAGLGNHCVIDGADFKGTTTIEGWNLYSLGSFPYILEGDNTLTVEVYEVDSDDRQRSLDSLEGYPNFYDRRKVNTEFGEAWIYFMHHMYAKDAPLIEHGDWSRFRGF